MALILRSRGIRTILVTGVATNVCCESTAREGFMKDYHVVFVEDCNATPSRAEHEATLVNIRKFFGVVATSDQIVERWRALPQAAEAVPQAVPAAARP
ncbi:MAG: isochorismatase family protein [Deltaproteobacteria bacterium]|nr:isochorismatase family protein [Deltaproteobacteria bacterium]